MRTEIDVRGMLARTGMPHSDLITRPTGRAVRSSIEAELAGAQGADVVILDFSAIRLIDFSCADEILARLVQLAPCVVVMRGLAEHHVDPVLQVLERQHLAVVIEGVAGLELLGSVEPPARAAFDCLAGRRGAVAAPEDLAAELAMSADEVTAALDELAGRRLILGGAGRYHTPPAA